MERTLILVKPDAFARNLTGEIIARFERKGLRLVALQQMTMTRELAAQHYAEHEGKGFYDELVDFITSGPLVAMVLEGESAITAARQVIGATNPLEATTGSIRGDYAIAVGQNMVHGSDAPESAAREVALFFPGSRLILASASPQRRSILSRSAPRSSRGDRRRGATDGPPEEIVLENAFRKARAVADRLGAARPVLGVDTIVAVGRRIFHKPADASGRRDARRARRPRAHVLSGVCLIEGDTFQRAASRAPRSRFRRAHLAADRLVRGHRRVARARRRIRDPGAGRRWWRAIEGDYLNVVGLPVATLLDLAPWLL